MTALQKTIVTTTFVVLAAVAIREAREVSQLRDHLHILQRRQAPQVEQTQQLAREPVDVASRIALPTRESLSGEFLRLQGQISRLRLELAEQAQIQIKDDLMHARYINAGLLAENGNWAAALSEYLWCIDLGMQEEDYRRLGISLGGLVNTIAMHATNDLPTMMVVLGMRDKASLRLLKNESDMGAATELAMINIGLKDNQNTLALMRQLPENDIRLPELSGRITRELVEAQAYKEAFLGRPYENIVKQFEGNKAAINKVNIQPERYRDVVMNFVERTALHLEMLAGAGDIVHARELAAKVLAFDNTPETRSLLQRHLSRAGQAGLLERLPNP